MGIDRPGGTDTRAENAEKPPAEDRPLAPPPDRPGSPGQPSRLESLRAAREAQEARRAETGTQQTDEQERDEGESSSVEPADEDAQAEPESDRPGSETGQAWPDERGEQPYTNDTGELAPQTGMEPRGEPQDDKAESSSDGPADERPDSPAEPLTAGDRPTTGETEPESGETEQPEGPGDEPPRQETGEAAPESAGEQDRPDDRETENEVPQDRDHQPLPQRDGRVTGDDGNDARGEAGNEQQPQADDEPAGHDHTPQDELAPADQQDGGSETPQPAEDMVRASDSPEPRDAPAVRLAWLPATEEGVTRWASPGFQFNDQMTGTQLERRDRNTEGRPGTPATTEDEPNKYRDLPDRITDGIPGRGELRDPEDDPVDRNPDPEEERRRRWEPFERLNTGVDGVKKATEGARGYVEKPPPTGQAEVKTDAGPPVPKVNQANPTDTITGGIMLAALTIGTIFQAKNKIKNYRRN